MMGAESNTAASDSEIRIAVSACLLGEPVRYDGTDKRHPAVLALAESFEVIAVCPEIGAGLGVPRAPIQLVRIDAGLRAVGVADANFDVTNALEDYARTQCRALADICGYIFKARSPSCGLSSTPLFDSAGNVLEIGAGLYARILAECMPHLPMVEEEQLEDAQAVQEFKSRVREYQALRRR